MSSRPCASAHTTRRSAFSIGSSAAAVSAEEYDAAAARLLKSAQARPNLWYNPAYLVSAYALLGERDAAAKALATDASPTRSSPWPSSRGTRTRRRRAMTPLWSQCATGSTKGY